ncbi:MAG: XdhC family protein [Anaerolineales bacterium]|nr:XdhC family protein [Anaerolineales bacterium]
MNEVLASLAEIARRGTTGALCTIIKTKGSTPRKEGSKMLVYPDGKIVGSIGGGEIEGRVIQEAIDSLQSGESKILSYALVNSEKDDLGICGGTLEIFVDPLKQPEDIVVVGGGHVGRAVIHLAKWMGFRVTLSDDRKEFCSPEFVPDADDYIHCKLKDLPANYVFSDQTAVILATRNNKVDITGLPEILAEPSAYIGVISSQRRWKLTKEQLISSGVNKDKLRRIHAPIGLDIQAETPEEIAMSIMAEILQVKRGGTGVSLSTRE